VTMRSKILTRGLVTLVGAAAFMSPVSAQDRTFTRCDDPDGHPWIAQSRDRVMTTNELVALATTAAGDPASCEGSVTVWQGEEYRLLRIGFEHGVDFSLETMPPGVQMMGLSASDGFIDADAALQALRDLTERMGVSIDWTMAEERQSEGVDIEQYWDPDPGLNASASVGRSSGTIVSLRWSIAP